MPCLVPIVFYNFNINIHNIWRRKVLAKVQKNTLLVKIFFRQVCKLQVETFCFNLKFALALYIDVKIEELW